MFAMKQEINDLKSTIFDILSKMKNSDKENLSIDTNSKTDIYLNKNPKEVSKESFLSTTKENTNSIKEIPKEKSYIIEQEDLSLEHKEKEIKSCYVQ